MRRKSSLLRRKLILPIAGLGARRIGESDKARGAWLLTSLLLTLFAGLHAELNAADRDRLPGPSWELQGEHVGADLTVVARSSSHSPDSPAVVNNRSVASIIREPIHETLDGRAEFR